SDTGNNPSMPYSLLVVTRLQEQDGQGHTQTTNYTYNGGLQYLPANVFDRKFAGFASTTELALDRAVTTYFSQNEATSTLLGEQAEGLAKSARPLGKAVATPAGKLVQKTFFRWDPTWHGNSVFVGLGRQVQQDYAADGTHRDKATDSAYSS